LAWDADVEQQQRPTSSISSLVSTLGLDDKIKVINEALYFSTTSKEFSFNMK